MYFFTYVEMGVLMVAVGYLVFKYSARDVPTYVNLLVFVSWFMSFAGMIILPLDIFIALKDERQHIDLTTDPEFQYQINIWNAIYWSTFFLTWIILPVFQEYEGTGEFTWKNKLKRSLYNNILLYGIFAVLSVFFLVYLMISKKFGGQEMLAFIVSLSNSFGLFLIITLLGHGLVTIPRNWWRSRNLEMNLKFCQFEAMIQDERKQNAEEEMEDVLKIACTVNKNCEEHHPFFYSYTEKILKQVPKPNLQTAANALTIHTQSEILKDFGELTMEKITELNKNVKTKIAEAKRAETSWENLLEKAFLIEDILDNRNSVDYTIRSTFWSERTGFFGKTLDKLTWLWYVKLKNVLKVVLSVAFAALSVIVVVSEVTLFINIDFSGFGYLLKDNLGFLEMQIVCLIPLLYISWCVYYGLFHMKFSGFFGLYYNHHTDAPSLLFAAINFSRVSAPLCLNFLQILKIRNTAFNWVMGEINLVPIFGESFSIFFPIILVVLCLFNLLNVYGKFLSFLGLKQFEFTEDFNDEKIDEGKKLIYKARVNKERKFLSLNTTNLKNFHGYSSKMRLRDSYDSVFVADESSTRAGSLARSDLFSKKIDYESSFPGMGPRKYQEKKKYYQD